MNKSNIDKEAEYIDIQLRAFDAVEKAKEKIPYNWQDHEIHIIERIPIKNDTDFLTVKITFIRIENEWIYKNANKLLVI